MAENNETVAEIVREMNCSHEGMIAFEFQGYANGMARKPKTEARDGRKRCAPLTGSPERESGSKPTNGAASGLAATTDEAENKRTAKAALANNSQRASLTPAAKTREAQTGAVLRPATGPGSRVG